MRLLRIDTPERNAPGHHEAAAALAILLGKTESLYLTYPANTPRRDSFGRLQATLWADNTDCNAALLDSGHAQPFRPATRRENGGRK